MMIYLFVRQQVEDYPRWKEGFDTHLSARQAGGATGEALVLRNVDKSHEIIVLLGWRDLVTARTFSQSVSWQMAMKTMGVVGSPEVCFLKMDTESDCSVKIMLTTSVNLAASQHQAVPPGELRSNQLG